ncbi:MAG: hypothetical protein CW338_00485 [Clostridiales bacterium]|nr:hypothetical protein [Clostridiales bacterium]
MQQAFDARASQHSILRNSKRYGIHGKNRSRIQLQTDLKNARPYTDYIGKERRYLEEKRDRGCDPYVCKNKLILVSTADHVIVTTYLLPDWFKWNPVRKNRHGCESTRAEYLEYLYA